MSLHQFDFTYQVKEYGVIELELDPKMDAEEKQKLALVEIEESYPEIEDIKITRVTV